MVDDTQAQEDELLALASIYEDHVFSTSDDGDCPGGHFSAHLDLPQPFAITITQTGHDGEVIECSQAVEHLPPIEFYFQLPSSYPSAKPPKFTITCKWLSIKQLSDLCKKLDEIWIENEGMEILFMWMSFLKEDVTGVLNLTSPLNLDDLVKNKDEHSLAAEEPTDLPEDDEKIPNYNRGNPEAKVPIQKQKSAASKSTNNTRSKCVQTDGAGEQSDRKCESNDTETRSAVNKINQTGHGEFDSRAIQDIGSLNVLYSLLIDYDGSQKEKVFQKTLFTCQVCFNEKLGELCMKFVGCDHVYCKSCMKGYFQVQITEGNVQCLSCPTTECDSQAFPEQVRELVGEQTFQRYDRLLLQSSLETMSDIMYCPRQICGAIVMIEQEDNMGTCPVCRLVFCSFCKMAYHGVSPCRIQAEAVQGLREKYLNGTEQERKTLEMRYGRRSIQKIVEDSYSQDWLNEYSKQCPSCGTHIQKDDGCNKMTCTKCRCYFCWLCNSTISKNNPYGHFTHPDSNCFNRLFEGIIAAAGD